MNHLWKWIAATACLSVMCPAVAEARKPELQKVRGALQSGKQPVKIVCLGDSITGIYYHTGGRRAWPEMLEIALKRTYPKSKPVVVNSGLSADSTEGALQRFERDVLNHQPDVVVVMFGMNDMVLMPLDGFRQNLLKISQLSHAAGAAVVLCTQNSIDEVGASRKRTNKMLAEVAELIHQIGQSEQIPVADCFAAFETLRARDGAAWAVLLSDQIHPNIDGHKRLAEIVSATISGKPVSLQGEGPPVPAIPKTLRLLESGALVKVLAMPPYDTLIEAAVRSVYPDAQLEVSTWPVESQSAETLLAAADKVRKLGADWVILAVPASITAASDGEYRRFYTTLLNTTLSFGLQEYDVVACAPSLATPEISADAKYRERIALQVIAAQDLDAVTRGPKDAMPVAALLTKWFRGQAPGSSKGRQ